MASRTSRSDGVVKSAAARSQPRGAANGEAGRLLWWRLGIGCVVLLFWELAGLLTGSRWISLPSLVVVRLSEWAVGDLYLHIWATISEMSIGLLAGATFGVVSGMVLGRSPATKTILQPLLMIFYSVPLIAVAPLLIVYLGIDMAPKVALVAFVTSFVMLSTTMSGVEEMDNDLVEAVQLMGARKREVFMSVVLPSTLVWVIAGLRVALPNALVSAAVGEMLAARQGLGFLLIDAANQFDMVSLYAALSLMLIMGLLVSMLTDKLESLFLRWRSAGS